MNFVEMIAALKRAGYPDFRVEEKLAPEEATARLLVFVRERVS